MSHYTSIKTKYTNPVILKKVLNKLGHPYVEQNFDKNIEIPMNFSKTLKSRIYDSSNANYFSFEWRGLSYKIITDSQSWTQKEKTNIFLKKLELNYGYSETIAQALELGFIRSKVLTTNKNNNRFVFQRYVETKS